VNQLLTSAVARLPHDVAAQQCGESVTSDVSTIAARSIRTTCASEIGRLDISTRSSWRKKMKLHTKKIMMEFKKTMVLWQTVGSIKTRGKEKET
jgi:hypothetical protein